MIPHWAVFTDNSTPVVPLIDKLLNGPLPEGFDRLEGKKGALFSVSEILRWMEEELRHDLKVLTWDREQGLQSMSSGERKKALFAYILKQEPDYLILDNPFDNLDQSTREELRKKIAGLSSKVSVIQILSRKSDLLPFIDKHLFWKEEKLLDTGVVSGKGKKEQVHETEPFPEALPPPPENIPYTDRTLVELRDVSVSFKDKKVLHRISWKIAPGDFWELRGPNGSGKTTLLSLITGDSPKAYGQEIYLFGHRKGSGESVWDIKQHIGYITPALTDRFRGYHTLEQMLISGLVDSIGLYTLPTEKQKELAGSWLKLLGLTEKKDIYFHDLSKGQQRLIMCARAMIKHPLLLILDEPTADLDDHSARLVVHLVNKLGRESHSAVLFVSHREEPGLNPGAVFQLKPTEDGSLGLILT